MIHHPKGWCAMASVSEPSERVVGKAGWCPEYEDVIRTDEVQGRDEGLESPESDGHVSPGLLTAPKAQASPHRNPVSPTDPIITEADDGGSIARETTVRRVEDGAGSEGLPVTGRIGTMYRPEREPTCPRSDAAEKGMENADGVRSSVDTRCCATAIGCVPTPGEGWDSIDWERAETDVRRVQARIVKAARNGSTRTMQRLMRTVMSSYHGRCMAVRTVASNLWGDVPGEDGAVWSTSEDMGRAAEDLSDPSLTGRTVRRSVHHGTGVGVTRVPTMHDRAVQELYAMALRPVMEAFADPHSFGFREGRCVRDATASLSGFLKGCGPRAEVIVMRIGSSDDGRVSGWLSRNRGLDPKMLEQSASKGQLFGRTLFPHTPGAVAVGGTSPVLANMALDGMEDMLSSYGTKMVRYADVVTAVVDGSFPSVAVTDALKWFLHDRGLCLKEYEILRPKDGFDFLGFSFRLMRDRLTVGPSDGSVEAVCTEIRTIARRSAASTQGDLILRINRVIDGWSTYCGSVSHRTASRRIDHYVHQTLGRWASRRHPQKGACWVRDRYWRETRRGREFTDGEHILSRATDTKCHPHTPVRMWSDPYSDPWYFRERKGMTAGSTDTEWTLFGLPQATAPRDGVASGPSRMR